MNVSNAELRFHHSAVLKGQINLGLKGRAFRQTLVVLQFAFSILLVVVTAVIFNQLEFIRNKNLGFNKADRAHGFVLNEAAAKVLGWKSPVGKEIGVTWGRATKEGSVIGVVLAGGVVRHEQVAAKLCLSHSDFVVGVCAGQRAGAVDCAVNGEHTGCQSSAGESGGEFEV